MEIMRLTAKRTSHVSDTESPGMKHTVRSLISNLRPSTRAHSKVPYGIMTHAVLGEEVRIAGFIKTRTSYSDLL